MRIRLSFRASSLFKGEVELMRILTFSKDLPLLNSKLHYRLLEYVLPPLSSSPRLSPPISPLSSHR